MQWTSERHRAGNQLFFEVEARDETPNYPPLADPDEGVFVTLWRPDGTIGLVQSALTKMSVGIYRYFFQTHESDEKGDWTAEFRTRHGGHENIENIITLFTLV